MLFERVKGLADSKRMSLNEVELKIGFSRNTLYKWRSQTPNVIKVQRVADFFYVSIDYLIGRTNDSNSLPTVSSEPSSAKQITAQIEINGLSEDEIDEIEKEIELFVKLFLEVRLERIRKERGK